MKETLAGLDVRHISGFQHPDIRRAAALIALRAHEDALDRAGQAEIDREGAGAEGGTRAALALDPTDSFLWLMLYYLSTSRGGFDDTNLPFIVQSYAMAPLEGWIAPRRNRFALSVFSKLGKSTQQDVVSEFEAMVESGFVEEAVFNLIGVGWPQRERLLASLSKADVASREAFAKRLTIDGVAANVPGVMIDERLWRR